METTTAKPLPYNVNPAHISWQMLEASRLRRLGIPHRDSRRCNIVYNSQVPKENAALNQMPRRQPPCIDVLLENTKRFNTNSLAPFYTHEKRTCGYFFSRETDNRITKNGVPPSDLVAWRSNSFI
ncbi:uncharacterized protein LOC131931381 isoform X2 [Physella acuta]|uniref:uncharacterized protein LOC131931381 isoform X2 n=1 Tax=Physella acuta TaxID=109671 RepID=UPI0027DDE726|nr:uncharacterized protein LOC131931381 isoform X2 [Physella acuta]